jgi:hypothetical protein
LFDPPAQVRAVEDLKALAAEANAEHRAAEAAYAKGQEHQRRAGVVLLKAKEACVREQKPWLAWVAANLTYSHDTANRYMQMADEGSRPLRTVRNEEPGESEIPGEATPRRRTRVDDEVPVSPQEHYAAAIRNHPVLCRAMHGLGVYDEHKGRLDGILAAVQRAGEAAGVVLRQPPPPAPPAEASQSGPCEETAEGDDVYERSRKAFPEEGR